MEKYYYSEMSGTFSFEALMIYFRIVLVMTPFMAYLAIQTLLGSALLSTQLEGIYKQDDANHSRWIAQFGREFQLKPLQESCIFISCILSFSTFLITVFLLVLLSKSLKIGSDQTKNRLNDLFQTLASLVIPAICALVAIDSIWVLWYHHPYENIFEDLLPFNFCQAVLVMVAALAVVQLLGMKAGNCESSISVNVYIVLQSIFVVLLATQWSFIWNQYADFQQQMFTDQGEMANLMTYVHKSDFKFVIGGVGQMADGQSFMSCPSGKYKDHLSSSNLYELKCPKRDLIRMKWDIEPSERKNQENLYACLNIECKDQFKGWIESIVSKHLLLTGILAVCCVLAMYVAYSMKGHYSDQGQVMWHDDLSLGATFAFFFLIIAAAALFLHVHPDSVKVRTLKKFDHFQEFGPLKETDSKFQILKQETMRIDHKLMTVDQSRFDILALQISEDDSLCRPDCIPLVFNVTISSIHGNVYINVPSTEYNFQTEPASLFINETKNELNMNFIKFSGNVNDVNAAMRSMTFEPLCPLDTDNIIQLKVTAQSENGLEASGQLISMAIGQYKEIKGTGSNEIIDMPIYQHLSRNKNTVVIGKVIDSVTMQPIKNATVTAKMPAYQCETR